MPLLTNVQYNILCDWFEEHFDDILLPGHPDCDRLSIVATLLNIYEEQRYPIPEATAG